MTTFEKSADKQGLSHIPCAYDLTCHCLTCVDIEVASRPLSFIVEIKVSEEEHIDHEIPFRGIAHFKP
jgi:hypothetical protein